MITRGGLPLLVLLSLVARGTDAPERRGPTVRDSAGIGIVENTTSLWQEGEAWRLNPELGAGCGRRISNGQDRPMILMP